MVPSCAVTVIETKLLPVLRPVAPETTTVALPSLATARTVAEPTPCARFTTAPTAIAEPFTLRVARLASLDSDSTKTTTE